MKKLSVDYVAAHFDKYPVAGISQALRVLDAFTTAIIQIAAMMVAIYAVQVVLRMREEEVRSRLVPLLLRLVDDGGFGGSGCPRSDLSRAISSAHCPNCGAPEEGGTSAECAFCGVTLNDGLRGWLLTAVRSAQEAAEKAAVVNGPAAALTPRPTSASSTRCCRPGNSIPTGGTSTAG